MESARRTLIAWGIRAASIAGGVSILHHEVYETESAEWLLVGLGLWLIVAPPAQLLDTLRRASTSLLKGDDDDRRSDDGPKGQ